MNFTSESKAWEYLALFALLATLVWMGPANIWDQNIDHDHPYGYYAQDAFIFLSYQYYLEESGNWAHLAPYLARGHHDVIQSQPSALEILSTLLAQTTGLAFPTTTYVTVMLLVFLAVFCFYFIIRSFNPKIALLALPLNVLLFSNVFMSAFTWGNWPFFAGTAMFVLFLWCLCHSKERFIPALMTLALAAVAFAHTSEYVFAGFVLATVLAFAIARSGRELLRERFASPLVAEWKPVILAGLASFAIALPYLIIFVQTFMHDYQPQYLSPESQGLSLFVSVATPGLWLALALAAGAVIGIVLLPKHRVLLISTIMLLIGFTNYVGTGKRGLETRYFWPVYLSVFFGLLLYVVLKNVLKNRLSTRACALISIALIAALGSHYYADVSGAGLLSREGWQGMEWIARETPLNASALYVYGDAYGQAAVLFNVRRNTDVILVEDYVAMAQAGGLRRTVQTERVFDHTGDIAYRTGLFTLSHYKDTPDFAARGPRDLCGFDYYVLDKVSRIPGAAQFNTAIAQSLTSTGNFSTAYENPGVLILRNPQPGGDCLAQ